MTLETATNGPGLPDMTVSVRQVFGIDSDLEMPAYSQSDEHVPDVDPDYLFNRDVTLAILATGIAGSMWATRNGKLAGSP